MNEAPGSPAGRSRKSAASAGRQAASTYLQQLLLKPGQYRQAWERYVIRTRPGSINQLAVAEVLARYLSSQEPAAAPVRPLQMKDTVSRALSGRLLAGQRLSYSSPHSSSVATRLTGCGGSGTGPR